MLHEPEHPVAPGRSAAVVLQLNADYSPMKVLRWERAVEHVLDGKAVTVAPYEGLYVRSASLALSWPAVIALKRYTHVRGRVKFSPANVAARDSWACCYCGIRPTLPNGRPDRAALTLDHVVPRAHAKHGAVFLPWSKTWVNVTCWQNAATSCRPCNARKADRTPAQANMPLRAIPRAPTQADVLRVSLEKLRSVPPEWAEWVPASRFAEDASAAGAAGAL